VISPFILLIGAVLQHFAVAGINTCDMDAFGAFRAFHAIAFVFELMFRASICSPDIFCFHFLFAKVHTPFFASLRVSHTARYATAVGLERSEITVRRSGLLCAFIYMLYRTE